MKREHASTELCRGANRAGYGVGNIVQFEIEEDIVARGYDVFDDRGARGDVEFEAYFEPGAGALERVDEANGGGRVGDIEGNDQALACERNGVSAG